MATNPPLTNYPEKIKAQLDSLLRLNQLNDQYKPAPLNDAYMVIDKKGEPRQIQVDINHNGRFFDADDIQLAIIKEGTALRRGNCTYYGFDAAERKRRDPIKAENYSEDISGYVINLANRYCPVKAR